MRSLGNLAPSLILVLLAACFEDDPATTPGLDAGLQSDAPAASPDAPEASPDAPPDAPPGTNTCSIAGNNYRIRGDQLFKVSADLRMSYLVGKVATTNDVAFVGTTSGVQIGSALIVSNGSCPFCRIPLPPVVLPDGTVRAEALPALYSGVKYVFDPGIADNVVVWTGRFSLYDIAQNIEMASAGITFSGGGLICTKVYAVTGNIMPTSYAVRFLGQCGDGNGPTWATLVDTSGTETSQNNWTQDSFQVVASTKNSAANYPISRADLGLGLYAAGSNVYTLSGAAFVPDPNVYQQCNPLNGNIASGATPLMTDL